MNTNEIQIRLDLIVGGMIARGKTKPDATFSLRANSEPGVYLRWTRSPSEERDLFSSSDYKSHFVKGETIADMLDNADAWVLSLPTPEQAALADFTNLLARTIELGNKVGIDPQFVNPLTEAMKRLSENAITFRGEK